VTDPLEAELDQLFQLLPAQLVAARNTLAARLKKDGDKASAGRVAALKRPTPAAWAINQVHFHEPKLLEQVSARAATLRELHAADGVDGRQLSAAVEAQRSALQAVVDAAVGYSEAVGLAGGPAQQRKIFTMVQAWLSGAADEPPGRMTHDLESSGFDALTSVGLVLPQAHSAPSNPNQPRAQPKAAAPASLQSSHAKKPLALAVPAAPAHPDPHLVARATDELSKCEREARRAVEETRARAGAQKQAEHEFERARLSVRDAERALVHLRAAVAQREASLNQAQKAAMEAQEEQARTEQAVATARTELAALRSPKRH
jgi:hypothetical protein